MWKKILVIILILAIGGAGGYGTYHFYKENKMNIESLTNTQAQLSAAQSELNAIGSMTNAFVLTSDVLSGQEITENDFTTVYVPSSALNGVSYYDGASAEDHMTVNSLVGRKFRSAYHAGDFITDDMLMTEEEATSGLAAYGITIGFDSLPVDLEVGDTVDIRLLLMNGEEYVILDHKIIKGIAQNVVTLHVTEEENALINSMYSDLGVYSNACVAYLYKYLEPGNKQTLSFYPVNSEMESMLLFNPNITDATRCINPTLRAHLDQTLTILSDSANQSVSGLTKSYITTQISNANLARQQYLTEKEQARQESSQTTTIEGTSDVVEGTEEVQEVDPEAIE